MPRRKTAGRKTAASRPDARTSSAPAPVPKDVPAPAAAAVPSTAGAPLHDLRDQLAEGGEMQQEPRGGWRFGDPREDAAHGAAAPLPPLVLPRRPDPFNVVEPGDEARESFEGDPQNPAHAYPRSGTQGTWDGSIPAPRPPAQAGPGREEPGGTS
jgi:hypothetical protein